MRAWLGLILTVAVVGCSAEDGATGASREKVDDATQESRDDASSGSATKRDGAAALEDPSRDAAVREEDAATDPNVVRDASADGPDDADASGASDAGDDDAQQDDASTSNEGKRCGTKGAKMCKPGEYCDFGGDPLCGATDKGGTCQVISKICPQIYLPVCGCDKKTYANACTAASQGVSVATDGACLAVVDPILDPVLDAGTANPGFCGGFAGFACAKGEFCNYEKGQGCGIADGTGQCEALPEVCSALYDPVCGCDGKTYSSACAAHSAGASVKKKGGCP